MGGISQPSSGYRHGHDLGRGLPSPGTPHPSGRLGRTSSPTKGSPPPSQGPVPVGSRGQDWGSGCIQGTTSLPTLGCSLNPQLLEFTCCPWMTGTKDTASWLPIAHKVRRMSLGGRGKTAPKRPTVQPVRTPEFPEKTLTVQYASQVP